VAPLFLAHLVVTTWWRSRNKFGLVLCGGHHSLGLYVHQWRVPDWLCFKTGKNLVQNNLILRKTDWSIYSSYKNSLKWPCHLKNFKNSRYGHRGIHTLLFIFSSPTLSFIPDLKSSFSANPPHSSLSFSSSGLTTWFHRLLLLLLAYLFLLIVFLFYNFQLLVPCGRLSWFMSAFEHTLK